MDTRLTKEEIIKSWQKETDAYLLTALTKDIEKYPPDVRKVIKEEAMRRRLITRTGDKDNQYVFSTKAVAWKQRINNKTRRQLAVGIIAALILAVLGIFVTVKSAYVISIGLWGFWWWLLFMVAPTVLLAIYACALLMKKLRVVRWIYSNRWCVFMLCLLFSIVLFIKSWRDLEPPEPWREAAPHLFLNVIFLSVVFGVISFFSSIGLKGLEGKSESGAN